MEQAQINAAQEEYDATIGDQPSHMLTDYELADKLRADAFYMDQGDYLMCDSKTRALVLWTYMSLALKAEQDGDQGLCQIYERDTGRVVIENFRNALRDLADKGLL